MLLPSCFERLEYKAEGLVFQIYKRKHSELAVDGVFSLISIDLLNKNIVFDFADYANKISAINVQRKSWQQYKITRKTFRF